MAIVSVNSFEEFVAAAAVAGDTVVLPVKAKWEMNDIYPEGYNGDIDLFCDTIEGNGTTINNFHTYGRFCKKYALRINNLKITNFVCDFAFINNSKRACFIASDNSDTGDLILDQCIMSGVCNANVERFSYKNPKLNRCSLNVQFTTNRGNATGIFPVAEAKYCRIRQEGELDGASAISFDNCKFCELEIHWSTSTSRVLYLFGASGCKITGSVSSAVRIIGGDGARDFPSIVIDTLSENLPVMPYVPAVTYAQMYDASYLASLGFPVGVN